MTIGTRPQLTARRICKRCAVDRGEPTPLTYEQLVRLFRVTLIARGDDHEQLAGVVMEITATCPPCVDLTLSELERWREDYVALLAAGATDGEAELAMHTRITTPEPGRE